VVITGKIQKVFMCSLCKHLTCNSEIFQYSVLFFLHLPVDVVEGEA
jgi:hypothetical protein